MFGYLKSLFEKEYRIKVELVAMENGRLFQVRYDIQRAKIIRPPYAPSPTRTWPTMRKGTANRGHNKNDCWFTKYEALAIIEELGKQYKCKPHIKTWTWYKPEPTPAPPKVNRR